MGVAFAFMWSSAFTSARIIVQSAPPITTLSLRFLISGLIAVGIAAALGQSARLTRTQWRSTIIFGISQNALYLGLFFVAMQWLEASLAAIIASAMPLLAGLFGRVLYSERIGLIGGFGLLGGFGGVALIMGERLGGGGADTTGLVICAIGVLALTVATLSVRSASSGGNVLMIVGLQMLVGSAALSVPGMLFETHTVIWSWQLIAAFTYTTLVPGLAATWVWFTLVRRIGATQAATFHFLNPFFAVGIAALVLGEALQVTDFIGVAVIAAGILAVQKSRVRA